MAGNKKPKKALKPKRALKQQQQLAKEPTGDGRNTKEKEKSIDEERAWSDLLVELLELIFSDFCLRDNIRVSAVCQRWRSIALSIRPYQWPWLFYFRECGRCEIFDPSERKTYITEIPAITKLPFVPYARICCSKGGWLLVRVLNNVFFFNPFTKDTIDLPEIPRLHDYRLKQTFAISSVPTSPSCMVLVFQHPSAKLSVVYSWCPGETVWTSMHYAYNLPFLKFKSPTTPVFCEGLVYSLSNNNEVTVFEPEKRRWELLNVPPPLLPSKVMGKIITDFRGDLLLVFVCYNKKPIILKLDKLSQEWRKVNSFGGLTLFAGFFSSHVTVEFPQVMKNSVYFPKLRKFGKHCISFSLDDHRYYPTKEWHGWGVDGPFGSQTDSAPIWLEPPENFEPSFDEL